MTPYPRALAAFPTLRQSLLAAFDACALETKFDLDYESDWSTHPQARGTVFHHTAAKCLEEMQAHGEPRIEVGVALAILGEAIRQDDVDRECPDCGEVVERYHALPTAAERKRGVRRGHVRTRCAQGHDHSSRFVNLPASEIVDLYWTVKKWATDNSFAVEGLVDVEQRMHAAITYPDGEGGHVERTITGQVDAWFIEGEADEHATVIDWKDTWTLPGPTAISFEGYFQQRFYALLVFENFPTVRSVTLREFYVRRSQVREATLWRDDLPVIRDEVSAIAERFDRSYEEDAWTATPGRQCGYCPRPAACPIPRFARGEGRIRDDADAEKVAAQLLVAEVVVKQTKAALAAWADQTGPIPVKDAKGERLYGHRAVTKTQRPDRAKVAAEVEAAQRERRPVDIERLYRTYTGTEFKQYTPTPEERPEAQDAAMLDALERSFIAARAKRT